MYQVYLSKSAAKSGKKQGKVFVTRLKSILTKLSENPYPPQSERLAGEFSSLYSYHFNYSGTAFRIAYTADEEAKTINIVLIGPRENFYKNLKQKLS